MEHFPPFLERDAFPVFTKMLHDDKRDEDKVKKKMSTLFSLTKVQAYWAFTSRKLKQNKLTSRQMLTSRASTTKTAGWQS